MHYFHKISSKAFGLAYYSSLTNFSTNYLMMCKVYTNVGGIKYLYHVCPPVRKIIHSLKLVDYLHVHADNPWYNYYVISMVNCGEFLQHTLSNYMQCFHEYILSKECVSNTALAALHLRIVCVWLIPCQVSYFS